MAHKILAWAVGHISLVGVALVGLYAAYLIFRKEKREAEAKDVLQKAIETKTNEPATMHPEVDPALCLGCGSCTRVCPEGENILGLINHKSVLVNPSACVGHGECERGCPTGAIKMVFGTKTRGMDIPRLSKDYETNVPGLYIAGELGGMGLIRNAIKQGAIAAKHALSALGPAAADYDILIVGAGPAGLAAAMMATVERKKYICIEQNTFGGTVANFPRQKIVMSHPFELPGAGVKKFHSNEVSKESLLEYWRAIRVKFGIKIQENEKFESLAAEGQAFRVKTSAREVTAKKVILALGVRGSPRRLNVPGESLEKVTYNLLDPEQYQSRRVVVVGGGNAGVEAAQALAQGKWKNKVHLLVRGPSFDRCNAENQRRIRELESAGRVTIWMNAEIKEISRDAVQVKKGDQAIGLPNDFVFIYAGAEMPHKFLMSLGIVIDKKFGEGLEAG